MPALTEYENQRLAKIAENERMLAALMKEMPGLAPATAPRNNAAPKKTAMAKTATASEPRKRKADVGSNTKQLRRSARAAKPIDRYIDHEFQDDSQDEEFTGQYSDEDEDHYEDLKGSSRRNRQHKYSSFRGPSRNGDSAGLKRRIVNGRNVQHIDPNLEKPNAKVFGHIPGVEVGHIWPSRMASSAAGVHPPTVAGIYGNSIDGCYSVALSGGYEDDVDQGHVFTFTGSGGRDLKGTKAKPKNLRTAPQSSDQVYNASNLSLKISFETGKPVRVIRGYKATLGPDSGYRYDGLYKVVRHWQDVGLNKGGFKVFKYALQRLDGQDPLDLTIKNPPAEESDFEESDESDDIKAEPGRDSEHEADVKAEDDDGSEAAEQQLVREAEAEITRSRAPKK